MADEKKNPTEDQERFIRISQQIFDRLRASSTETSSPAVNAYGYNPETDEKIKALNKTIEGVQGKLRGYIATRQLQREDQDQKIQALKETITALQKNQTLRFLLDRTNPK